MAKQDKNNPDALLTRYIQELINKDTDWEPRLIVCLYNDGEFLESTFSTLCRHHNPVINDRVLDFKHRQFNAIYFALQIHYHGFRLAGLPYTPPNLHMLEGYLRSVTSKPETCGLSPDQIPDTVEKFKTLLDTVDYKQNLPLIKKGYPMWIHRKKAADVVIETSANPFWRPEELMNELHGLSQKLSFTEIKRDFSISELEVKEEDQPERLATGISELDILLGGGFAKGASAGCISPSGGGKTVTGTQCALGILLHNPNTYGLYITTEQKPEELFPRWVSMYTQTPFEKVADGVDPSKLDEKVQTQIKFLYKQLDKRFVIHYWEKKGPETTFEQDLEKVICNFIDKHGKLDFIIVDWLGANLNAKAKSADMLRIVYKMAADSMNDLAIKYNTANLFFAQADTKSCITKKHIGPEDARECKDLHFNTSVFWGISALRRSNPKGDNDAKPDKKSDETKDSVYQEEQYWTFSKVRKGVAKVLTVKRNFKFQRFLFSGESGGKLQV